MGDRKPPKPSDSKPTRLSDAEAPEYRRARVRRESEETKRRRSSSQRSLIDLGGPSQSRQSGASPGTPTAMNNDRRSMEPRRLSQRSSNSQLRRESQSLNRSMDSQLSTRLMDLQSSSLARKSSSLQSVSGSESISTTTDNRWTLPPIHPNKRVQGSNKPSGNTVAETNAIQKSNTNASTGLPPLPVRGKFEPPKIPTGRDGGLKLQDLKKKHQSVSHPPVSGESSLWPDLRLKDSDTSQKSDVRWKVAISSKETSETSDRPAPRDIEAKAKTQPKLLSSPAQQEERQTEESIGELIEPSWSYLNKVVAETSRDLEKAVQRSTVSDPRSHSEQVPSTSATSTPPRYSARLRRNRNDDGKISDDNNASKPYQMKLLKLSDSADWSERRSGVDSSEYASSKKTGRDKKRKASEYASEFEGSAKRSSTEEDETEMAEQGTSRSQEASGTTTESDSQTTNNISANTRETNPSSRYKLDMEFGSETKNDPYKDLLNHSDTLPPDNLTDETFNASRHFRKSSDEPRAATKKSGITLEGLRSIIPNPLRQKSNSKKYQTNPFELPVNTTDQQRESYNNLKKIPKEWTLETHNEALRQIGLSPVVIPETSNPFLGPHSSIIPTSPQESVLHQIEMAISVDQSRSSPSRTGGRAPGITGRAGDGTRRDSDSDDEEHPSGKRRQ